MTRLFQSSDRVFYCVCYVVFALPLMLFYTYAIPAFQVPDESSHFARAYQITHGEFFPTKQEVPDSPGEYTVGGTVDPGIYDAANYFKYLPFNSEQKLIPAFAALANGIQWTRGEMRDIRSVSVYGPTFYVAPALGVMLGQSLDKSIIETLRLSRLLSGLMALALACTAMLTLRRGFGVFFVLLLMPMTLAQMASASHDALCFASAALCAALLSRLNPEMTQGKYRTYLIVSALLLFTVESARPPYIALSLFYLYIAFIFRAHTRFAVECCTAFTATALLTILWSLYVAFYVSVPFGLPGANYGQQVMFVLQSPLEWVGILAATWQQRWDFFVTSFIGIVGHLDTPFPLYYYCLAIFTLCVAFFMSFLADKGAFFSRLAKQALAPCVIILASMLGLFLVLYISWSPVKNPIVEGVQGRYFIPLAFFMALGASTKALTGTNQIVYRCVMLFFAVSTLFITPTVVLARYY